MNLLFAAFVIFAAAFYPHKARTEAKPVREPQGNPVRQAAALPANAPAEMAALRPGGAS